MVRKREEEEAMAAAARLNAGNIAAEEEKLGPFSAKIPVATTRGLTMDVLKEAIERLSIRPFTPEEIEALDAYKSEPLQPWRPEQNPAHRERFGLDGAWDAECDDVCCRPAA